MGLIASLWSGSRRWQTETRNRGVEITLDMAEVRTLSAAEGVPLGDLLRRFRKAGVTSVAIQEETVGALEEARRIEIRPSRERPEGIELWPVRQNDTSIARVWAAVEHKTHYRIIGLASPGPEGVFVGQSYGFVRSVGVGLDPALVDEAKNAGLLVVARVNNYDGVRAESITWTLDELKNQGASTVIFSGDEVLGFKGHLVDDPKKPDQATTESVMRATGLNYGLVEFGKQKGDMALAKALPEQTVRVHTVLGSEMVTADFNSNVQRFLLAARERDIRMLYVRLFLSEPDTINANTDKYIEKIAEGLKRGNLVAGPAHGYGELSTPLWARGLIGVGITAAFVLVVDYITGLLAGGTGKLIAAGTGAGVLLLLALPVLPMSIGVKLAALAAACVYPTLALVHRDALEREDKHPPLLVAVMRIAVMSAITFLGIAAIIGLLADRMYFIKVDVFLGIKGAQLGPVLIVALVYGFSLQVAKDRSWSQVLSDALARVQRLAAQPILLWQVAAGVVGLVVLLLLVTRSGNDSAVGVSPIELRFRSILDLYLPARPRFKEFLIGHPAMVLAIALAARGKRQWAFPLFLVGAIGQVSLLNTFCHLHTPIPVSMARALLGLIIGVIIGVVVYIPVDKFLRLLPRASDNIR